MSSILVKDGRIIDGSGCPWYKDNLLIEDGIIKSIGRLKNVKADATIDAEGRFVAPGFINAHAHTDMICCLINKADGHLKQGVTTDIGGMCGTSPAPVSEKHRKVFEEYSYGAAVSNQYRELFSSWNTVKDWMEAVDSMGLSIDLGVFVGHGTIRAAAMGYEDREPTEEELNEMRIMVRESMEAGVMGLSSGLVYSPGIYAKTDELIELCKVIAKYNGIYISHIRSECCEVIEAIEEAILIGRETGCRVHISHHKAIGKANYGKVVRTLELMEEARKQGIDITCDVYPYTGAAASISSLLPNWVHGGGADRIIEIMKDKNLRERIKEELDMDIPYWENIIKHEGFQNIVVSSSNNKEYEGKNIAELAGMKNTDPKDLLLDIIRDEGHASQGIFFIAHEEDNFYILKHRLSMIGSDSSNLPLMYIEELGKLHPRTFGTFPRVLGKCCREHKLFDLETAVWKMTGFPALRYGLKDRGFVREGLKADLVIFDHEAISDNATYESPFQEPSGIDYVIKNGEVVVVHNHYDGRLLGKIIRRRG